MAGRNSIVLDTYGRAFEGRFRKHLATSDTDLVIDGFGGSGNSFAVLAFDSAQSSRVNVAHHSHMPIQFTHAGILQGTGFVADPESPRHSLIFALQRLRAKRQRCPTRLRRLLPLHAAIPA